MMNEVPVWANHALQAVTATVKQVVDQCLQNKITSIAALSTVGIVTGTYSCWRQMKQASIMWPHRERRSEGMITAQSNVALVGATDGIGLALAIKYSKMRTGEQHSPVGCVYIVGKRSLEEVLISFKADDNAGALAMFSTKHVRYIQADVSHVDCGVRIAAAIECELDLVVYLAGCAKVGPMLHETEDSIRRTIATNFTGAALVTKHLLKKMGVVRGDQVTVTKRVVFVSSVVSSLARPAFAVYVASKSALGMLGWSLDTELKGSNVGVQIVHPGASKTNFFSKCGIPGLDTSEFEDVNTVATKLADDIALSLDLSCVYGSTTEKLKFLLGSILPTSAWPLSVGSVLTCGFEHFLSQLRSSISSSSSSFSSSTLTSTSLSHVKSAVVTGAARGLGHSIVEKLLEHSSATVYAYDVIPHTAVSDPSRVKEFCVDLSKPNLLMTVENNNHFPEGAIDLLVCNAAVNVTGRLSAVDDAKIVATSEINFSSAIVLVNAALRHNEALGASPPAVVFLSSLSHYFSYPGASVYGATKEGLVAYARCVRAFTNGKAQILGVFPGPMQTQMAWDAAPTNDAEKVQARVHPDVAATEILTCVADGRQMCFIEGAMVRKFRQKATADPAWGAKLMQSWQLDPLVAQGIADGVDVGV
eukprot:m.156119 g.156119  ORF g.156119 m.156119 type:complete len:646 (+) comp30975_c0_seq1:133-2070(+)